MSDEQLRIALDRAANGAPGASRLDAAAAVRASRARRLPAQLLAGTAAAMLVLGAGGLAIAALPGVGGVISAADESADAPTAGEADGGAESGGGADSDGGVGGGGVDAGALAACGAAPPVEPDSGLELVVRATGDAGPEGIPVRITLRGTAEAPLELRLVSAPAAALASDGRIIGPAGADGSAATRFALDPGAERTWTALVPTTSCATGAPLDPAAVEGAALLAAVAVELLDAGGEVVAVISEPSRIAAR